MTAEEIYANVLASMQRAEEIGGPDSPEYRELMHRIAEEALARARASRVLDEGLRNPVHVEQVVHTFCRTCGQDIEGFGDGLWLDRGSGRHCLPYHKNGEIVHPPSSRLHHAADDEDDDEDDHEDCVTTPYRDREDFHSDG